MQPRDHKFFSAIIPNETMNGASSSVPPSPTPAAAAAEPGVVSQARELFVKYVGEFLCALGDKYPDCAGVQGMRLQYGMGIEHAMSDEARAATETTLVTTYHKTMTPFYDRVTRRDDTVFADAAASVEFVRTTAIADKWAGADQDTRDCIYEYLDLMNRFARMYALYATVPTTMMSKITSVASKLAADLESGSVTPDSIDLASVGQSVVSQVDQTELQQFATSMLSNQSQMQGMLGMVASMQQGNPLGGMMASMQQPGNPLGGMLAAMKPRGDA